MAHQKRIDHNLFYQGIHYQFFFKFPKPSKNRIWAFFPLSSTKRPRCQDVKGFLQKLARFSSVCCKPKTKVITRQMRRNWSSYEKRNFQLSVESNPELLWFCINLLWLVQKTCATLSTNQMKRWHQSQNGRPRFPALSRALGNLLVFTWSSHWLLKVFFFLLIGCFTTYSGFEVVKQN